jgi:hypothetical protein
LPGSQTTEPGSDDPTPARPVGPAQAGGPVARDHTGEPTSNRTARFAWGAVAVILVGVVVLVVLALTGPPPTPGVVHRAATSSDVITAMAKVPDSVFDQVGVTAPDSALTAPRVLTGQPPLLWTGKPEVLFIGADFCPFCGAERWPLIVALSRFGHFTSLHNMQSAPLSVFSDLQTFSFVGSAYTSRYVAFTGVELYSGAANADGAFTRIATLTPTQSATLARYGTAPTKASGPASYPFVDIDNTMVTSTAGFSPALIVGQSQSAIVAALSQPDDPIGEAIVSSANYLTAGICLATGHQPQSVCSSKGVRTAAHALGVGTSRA